MTSTYACGIFFAPFSLLCVTGGAEVDSKARVVTQHQIQPFNDNQYSIDALMDFGEENPKKKIPEGQMEICLSQETVVTSHLALYFGARLTVSW